LDSVEARNILHHANSPPHALSQAALQKTYCTTDRQSTYHALSKGDKYSVENTLERYDMIKALNATSSVTFKHIKERNFE
jgi:hypothetical protein